MRKIPTLYQRDPETNLRHVMAEVHPDCGWVLDGEGVATYKWDGTAVRIDGHGVMWKRREVKPGKPVPEGFDQEGDADPVTGKLVGWVPCDPGRPEDRWHWEAYDFEVKSNDTGHLDTGTYELIGPKVQGNPHHLGWHRLVPHGQQHGGVPDLLDDLPTGFAALGKELHVIARRVPGFEGVVWHHPDGRMAKIKVRDFPAPALEAR
jgi:hypothetical protein